MRLITPINCPECNHIAGFNNKFNKRVCSYCGWQSEELFKGNENYLDDFINQLRKYIILDGSHFYDDKLTEQELKQSLTKLLNSL